MTAAHAHHAWWWPDVLEQSELARSLAVGFVFMLVGWLVRECWSYFLPLPARHWAKNVNHTCRAVLGARARSSPASGTGQRPG
jgi:hypothetical protein